MDNLPLIITIIQIIVSFVLVALILMQESSEVSGVFGGGDHHGFYQTRRGVEKGVFVGTIVFTVLFVALALLDIVLPNLQNIF